jgi:hypothetical protein
MTRPTIIYFGPDGPKGIGKRLKVTLRMLLYSTSQQGYVLENTYIKLSRDGVTQTLSIWTHGDGPQVRGSGIYVGREGVTSYHHYLFPEHKSDYKFVPGQYIVEVYSTPVNQKSALLLSRTMLTLSEEEATAIRDRNLGVYFDWEPDVMKYHTHIDEGTLSNNAFLDRLVGKAV